MNPSENSVIKRLEDISKKLSNVMIEYENLENHNNTKKENSGFFSGGKNLKIPKKTNMKHKCSDGVERVVYKLGNVSFIKRKNKSGKMKFYKI